MISIERQQSSGYNTADRLLVAAISANRRWLFLAVCAALMAAAGSLLLPGAVGAALDSALGDVTRLPNTLLLLGVVLVGMFAANVVTQLATTAGAASSTAWLRHRLVRSLLSRGLPGQRRYPVGDAISRVTVGASSAGRGLPLTLTVARTSVVTAAALILLGRLDWKLPLTLLIGVPVTVVLLLPFTRRATTMFTDYQDIQGRIAARLVDALRGIRTIRAAGTADREVDRILEPLPALRAAGLHGWGLQQGIAWAFALLVPALQVAIIAVAGWEVSTGGLSPGQLVAAIGYAGLALGALERVDMIIEFAQVRAGAGRLLDLAGPPTARTPDGDLPGGGGRVEFRDVTVCRDGRTVLDHCTLDIRPGSTVAVVGTSGSGKSTLVGLLGGLVEPTTGVVLLDAFPAALLAPDQRRAAVAYAFEAPTLLGDTVGGAIGYAVPDLSDPDDDRVVAAARAARADGFIRQLPRQYHTPVADLTLSGGERQRIGIARAVAQRPRVLVLDDATSSLDTATEASVTEALTAALPGSTKLVVAHRTAAAAAADRVVWLDAGHLLAVAPHRQLWTDPHYRALFAGTGHQTDPDGETAHPNGRVE